MPAAPKGLACSISRGETPRRRTVIETLSPGPPEARQGADKQSLESVVVVSGRGRQQAAAIRQPVAPAEQVAGKIVRRDDAAAGIELDDPAARVFEQPGHWRSQGTRIDQRLPDPHVLADVGQETRHRLHPGGGPAVAVDGVADAPGDARAARPVETRDEAVLAVAARQHLVEGRRPLLLLIGVKRAVEHHTAVRQLPDPRYALVPVVVIPEPLPLQVFATLTPEAEPREEELDVVPENPVGEDHEIALGRTGLIDQAGGRRPEGIVEHGFVQRPQEYARTMPARSRRTRQKTDRRMAVANRLALAACPYAHDGFASN